MDKDKVVKILREMRKKQAEVQIAKTRSPHGQENRIDGDNIMLSMFHFLPTPKGWNPKITMGGILPLVQQIQSRFNPKRERLGGECGPSNQTAPSTIQIIPSFYIKGERNHEN